MEYKDYYKIMGVARDASQEEIKRAYRKLARKYHPDVSKEPDAEALFKELGEAYEVLKDPEKRQAYEQLGQQQHGAEFRPPPDWDQGFEFHGDAFGFSDFFDSMFGRAGSQTGFGEGAPRAPHARGQDTHAKILIDLEDAWHGATRTLNLKHTELGSDGRPHLKERNLNVRIPKGVYQGQHIRLTGQGSPGIGTGETGDLYLEVEFRPHPFYHVEKRAVYMELPVAPWEAALGARVKMPTPDGTLDLKIPANSAAGRTLRLKGRGIPGHPPGDLYVILKIALPPADTEAAKQSYREMERALKFNPRAHLRV